MIQQNPSETAKAISINDLQKELRLRQDDNRELLKAITHDAEEISRLKGQSSKNLSEDKKESLIKQFIIENHTLRTLIEAMTVDRNNAQSKAILIEQQSEENANFKGLISEELKMRLKEIRKALIDKEADLQSIEIQRSGLILQQQGQPMSNTDLPENPALIVSKEAFCASLPLLRMHEDIEGLKKEIKDSIQDIEVLVQKRKQSYTQSITLKFHIEQLCCLLKQTTASSIRIKKHVLEDSGYQSDEEQLNAGGLKKKVGNFHRERLREQIKEEKKQKLLSQQQFSNLNVNSTIANAATQITGSLPAQRPTQIEMEVEKLKSMSSIWREKSVRNVENIKKIDKYNRTLEISNDKLIQSHKQLQTKIEGLNQLVSVYKQSYTVYQNLRHKNSRLNQIRNDSSISLSNFNSHHQASVSQTLQTQNSSEQIMITYQYEEDIDEKINFSKQIDQYSTPVMRAAENNAKGSGMTVVDSFRLRQEKLLEESTKKQLEKEESNTNLPIVEARQKSQQQQQQDDDDDLESCDASFEYLADKAACISHLNLIHTNKLPEGNASLPINQLKLKRSISDPLNSIAKKDKLILWSLAKRYLPRFPRSSALTEKDQSFEDNDEAEKNELILNLEGESDEETEEQQPESYVNQNIQESTIKINPSSNIGAALDNKTRTISQRHIKSASTVDRSKLDKRSKKDVDSQGGQLDNSFFNQLDISVIHKSKK